MGIGRWVAGGGGLKGGVPRLSMIDVVDQKGRDRSKSHGKITGTLLFFVLINEHVLFTNAKVLRMRLMTFS